MTSLAFVYKLRGLFPTIELVDDSSLVSTLVVVLYIKSRSAPKYTIITRFGEKTQSHIKRAVNKSGLDNFVSDTLVFNNVFANYNNYDYVVGLFAIRFAVDCSGYTVFHGERRRTHHTDSGKPHFLEYRLNFDESLPFMTT